MDTGRKLNEHKTFRKRPVNLLNVLFTLNLRPVSMRMAVLKVKVSYLSSKHLIKFSLIVSFLGQNKIEHRIIYGTI